MQVSVAIVLIGATLESPPRARVPRVLSHTNTCASASCMDTTSNERFTAALIPNENILHHTKGFLPTVRKDSRAGHV